MGCQTLLLTINAVFNHGFLRLEWRDGHLYGSLIDILSFGAPLMLVALGMTLVIATGGVDLSVGSVVAITGALAAGMTGLGFHGGSHCRPGDAEKLRAAGAVMTFDDLRQLPGLIGRIDAMRRPPLPDA